MVLYPISGADLASPILVASHEIVSPGGGTIDWELLPAVPGLRYLITSLASNLNLSVAGGTQIASITITQEGVVQTIFYISTTAGESYIFPDISINTMTDENTAIHMIQVATNAARRFFCVMRYQGFFAMGIPKGL